MLALIVVTLYLASLILVGVVKSRQVRGQTGFTLAGRNLGPFVLVGTLLATWTGTGTIFGNAEEAYGVGLPALVLPLSSAVGVLGIFVMVRRVRAMGSFTLQDILELRFGPVARVLGTLTLVTAYLVIVSYQLRAASAVLEGVVRGAVAGGELSGTGLLAPGVEGQVLRLALVALFIGVYTALAGMMSVAVTDTFNGLLMLAGVALALPMAWSAAGGWDGVAAALPESGRAFGGHYRTFDYLSILLPAFLLVLGDANLHQRFLSARSDKIARAAVLLLIPGILLVDWLVILLAVGGRALAPGLENPGHVVLELALTEGLLPPVLGALLVASILAIIISTADSFLLSSSASLVRDVYQRFIDRDANDQHLLRAARLMVAVLLLAAFGLTFTSDEFFGMALFAYTIYGVGITPPLLAALFWKRATPAGAISSMISATTLAILWRTNDWGTAAGAWLGQPEGTRVDAVVPSIVVALAVLVGVSLVTEPRAEEAADAAA